jgi:hypothetical protein
MAQSFNGVGNAPRVVSLDGPSKEVNMASVHHSHDKKSFFGGERTLVQKHSRKHIQIGNTEEKFSAGLKHTMPLVQHCFQVSLVVKVFQNVRCVDCSKGSISEHREVTDVVKTVRDRFRRRLEMFPADFSCCSPDTKFSGHLAMIQKCHSSVRYATTSALSHNVNRQSRRQRTEPLVVFPGRTLDFGSVNFAESQTCCQIIRELVSEHRYFDRTQWQVSAESGQRNAAMLLLASSHA